MHGEVGKIEKEGAILVLLDEAHGPVSEEIGQVGARFDRARRAGGEPEVEVVLLEGKGFVETPVPGLVGVFLAQMPFSEHARAIPGLPKCIRDRDLSSGSRVSLSGGSCGGTAHGRAGARPPRCRGARRPGPS